LTGTRVFGTDSAKSWQDDDIHEKNKCNLDLSGNDCHNVLCKSGYSCKDTRRDCPDELLSGLWQPGRVYAASADYRDHHSQQTHILSFKSLHHAGWCPWDILSGIPRCFLAEEPVLTPAASTGTLRIIGGKWRRRKITFAPDPAIRPSPDRVRETLFNWLQASITDARCLDLYAGSGILSIEALSRGAQDVILVDQSLAAIRQIEANLMNLDAETCTFHCVQSRAAEWLDHQKDTGWDLIFLDPPFESKELELTLPLIAMRSLLRPGGLVYIESAELISQSEIPPSWSVYKSSHAAGVHYCLCHRTS